MTTSEPPRLNDLPDRPATEPDVINGRELTLTFDTARCIHSRFCALQASEVFKANTPGEWIFPDRMNGSALAAVARNCPSGAISYKAADANLDEVDPPVNTIRLRQDGPYAVNARIGLPGQEGVVRRRTLCRCGASASKPYCDGSHARIGFEATGEPPTMPCKPLDSWDGPLAITPMRDSQLEVHGPAEMVSGTGRTFAKTTHALLCRCGGSRQKPFCDGTHALTAAFYRKVPGDSILEPVFKGMDQKHAEHVADFLAEVFGGGPIYSDEGGTHIGMIVKHLGQQITEEQRAHWVAMMIETADEIDLPRDAAFRDASVAYREGGSKLAVINSALGIDAPEGHWLMPACLGMRTAGPSGRNRLRPPNTSTTRRGVAVSTCTNERESE